MAQSSSCSNGHKDLDILLKNIQPPLELLAALKPPPSRTVADFLQIIVPLCPGSRKYFLEPSLWFSTETPNATFENVQGLILPSEKLCETLEALWAIIDTTYLQTGRLLL